MDDQRHEPNDSIDAEVEDLVDELSLAPVRLQGRAREPLYAAFARDLTPADIAALSQPRGTQPKSLQRLRASHHALAKCLASGMKQTQAALVCGYGPNRVSMLCQDPAFAALVEDYKTESREILADMTERMKNISLDALEELQERLTDAPEGFTTGMLLDVVKTFADRTGHGPNNEVNLNLRLPDTIDRPPRETREEWEERRAKELEAQGKLLLIPGGRAD